MAQPTVLVTGMSGLIGTALRERLAGRYALRALNRSRVDGLPCHQADIADLDAIAPAFPGADVVVHLAAFAHGGGAWADMLRSKTSDNARSYRDIAHTRAVLGFAPEHRAEDHR